MEGVHGRSLPLWHTEIIPYAPGAPWATVWRLASETLTGRSGDRGRHESKTHVSHAPAQARPHRSSYTTPLRMLCQMLSTVLTISRVTVDTLSRCEIYKLVLEVCNVSLLTSLYLYFEKKNLSRYKIFITVAHWNEPSDHMICKELATSPPHRVGLL